MNKNITHKIGFWSASIAIVLVFVYGLLQLLIGMNLILGIKESLWIFWPPFLLAPFYLLVVISLHYSVGNENKIWTSIALSIATIYCGQIVMLYIMQFAMPFEDILQRHLPSYNGLFDRYDFLIAIDVMTYFFISLSALFLAAALRGNNWIYKALLWIAILVPILIASIFYPLFYFAGVIWIVSFTMAMIEIAFFFRVSKKTDLNIVLLN
jgi:hypothetical protein